MNRIFITKCFLIFTLVINPSYSFSLFSECHKIAHIYNTSMDPIQDQSMCHAISPNQINEDTKNIDNENECSECKNCALNNQQILFYDLKIKFTLLALLNYPNIEKKPISFYINPKGPPPKKFS